MQMLRSIECDVHGNVPVMHGLLVRHLMSRDVVSLRQGQSLPLADGVMKLRHVRHLPVIDDDGVLVGIVTHRDLLAAQISSLTTLTVEQRDELELAIPVSRIMSPDVWSVRPDTPAADAAELMIQNQFGCAPVVDSSDRLVGILTESDFLELVTKLLAHAEPSTVADIMTRDVVTLRTSNSLIAADQVMETHGFRHLPVVGDNGELIGLVTHRDLLGAQHSRLATAKKFDEGSTVGDIVQRDVWSIESEATPLNAARMLRDHKFGCLPVVDDGVVVGIVTEADFLALVAAALAPDRRRGRVLDAPVNYYMTEPVRTVSPDDDLERAQQEMLAHGVSSLAVVVGGELVGVISRTDLLSVSRPSLTPPARPALLTLPTRHISELMTRDVVIVESDDTVVGAAATLVHCNIHRVFVVQSDQLVGVLSTIDVMLAVRDFRLDGTLRSLMSPVVFTMDTHEPIGAATEMLDRALVSGIIVVADGWPVGVFSQREALGSRDLPRDLPIEQVMSQELLCVPSETPVYRAAGQAAALGVRRVVALDAAGHMEGIVTGLDFARACATARA